MKHENEYRDDVGLIAIKCAQNGEVTGGFTSSVVVDNGGDVMEKNGGEGDDRLVPTCR